MEATGAKSRSMGKRRSDNIKLKLSTHLVILHAGEPDLACFSPHRVHGLVRGGVARGQQSRSKEVLASEQPRMAGSSHIRPRAELQETRRRAAHPLR